MSQVEEITDYDLFTPAITSPVDPDIKIIKDKRGVRRGVRPIEPSFAYSPDSVCEILDITKGQFASMRRKGLPVRIITHGRYLILGYELIDWVKTKKGDYDYAKRSRRTRQKPIRLDS